MEMPQPNKLLARTLQSVAFILIAGKRFYVHFVAGKYAWATLDDHLLDRAVDCAILLLIISGVAEIYDRYLSSKGRWLAVIGAALVICGAFMPDIVTYTGIELANGLMSLARFSTIVVGGIMAFAAVVMREKQKEELNQDTRD